MSELIECVPNFSEGRRSEVIQAVAEAVARVPGVLLLDSSSDPDHNRTVLTLAGPAEPLKNAIRAIYTQAIAQIDMRKQVGVHPRMGAVDVIPFVPINGIDMPGCIALARQTAALISAEFGVPTFLYARAAASPARARLSDIRKGGFEGMASKLCDPAWRPDFGPPIPHPSAGVSAVGARFFLIAYNVQLDTPDLRVARAIARSVRQSGGGLPAVQAMGVYLAARNQVQVSMNLLDYETTGLHQAYEAVKSQAALHGAQVTSSQIVGLAPQAAIPAGAARALQIEDWREGLILEKALQAKQAFSAP